MAATHGKFGILYKWNGTAANLAAEATTEAGSTAQITDTAKRILSPNCTDLAWTDDGGETVTNIDYTQGKAYFTGAVGNVTVSGTSAYVAAANLVKTAYCFSWTMDFSLASHDITDFQDAWRAVSGGVAQFSGSIDGYMVGSNWWDDVEDETDGTMKYWLLKLFSYDPDDDATGDNWTLWVLLSMSVNVPVGEMIKERITFEGHTYPHFTANS